MKPINDKAATMMMDSLSKTPMTNELCLSDTAARNSFFQCSWKMERKLWVHGQTFLLAIKRKYVTVNRAEL